MKRGTHRLVCGLVLGGVVLSGCSGLPGAGDRSTPTPAASDVAQPTGPVGRFAEPADACAAVAPATAQRFKLVRPSRSTVHGMDSDAATGQLVDYNIKKCSWSIDNPAKGPNGQPNMIDFTISYSVIDAKFPKSVEVVKAIYDLHKEKSTTDPKRQVKRTDAPTGLGDEAAYSFAVETSTVGEGGDAELLIRSSNAFVSISSHGGDLRKDPSKRPGWQLVTSAVTEERLQPAVMAAASEALRLLG